MEHGRSLTPGTVVAGRWRVMRSLSAGGFGVTYEAQALDTRERVALKEYMPDGMCMRDAGSGNVTVLPGDAGTPFAGGLGSFVKEAEALSRLRHPSIVRVTGLVEANRTAYMALQFIDGVTLDGWLAHLGRRPTQAELDRLLWPLLGALIQVHSTGMLHRDIKPANIMVRRDGGPVLIDFGASKRLLTSLSVHAGRAGPGQPTLNFVTPAYAAPEQLDVPASEEERREIEARLGPWTDVFAFGAMLYQIVTDRLPLAANLREHRAQRDDRDPYERLAEMPRGTVQAGSERPWNLLEPDWRPEFLAAIDKALSLRRSDRPQSAVEFRTALGVPEPQSSPRGQTRGSDPASPPAFPTAQAAKRSLAAPLAAAAVVMALLAGGLWWWQEVRGARDITAGAGGSQVSDAEAKRKKAEQEAHLKEEADRRAREQAEQQRRQQADPVAALVPGSGQSARDRLADGRDCPFCPEMVVVPAGTFRMGSPDGSGGLNGTKAEEGRDGDEGPVREVTIRQAFAVGRTHVTRGEFAVFMRESGHQIPKGCVTGTGSTWEQQADASWQAPGFAQDDSHPVVCINWDDANAYAKWLSGRTVKTYRLLKEAEMEYAIRGVTRASDPHPRYWFGNEAKDLCAHANGADQTFNAADPNVAPCRDGFTHTAPIANFKPNAFGLYHATGNAWSWTEDCWIDNYRNAPSDERARTAACTEGSRRVVRGGSWSYYPQVLRSAYRVRSTTDDRVNDLSLRVGRTF